MAQLVGRLLLIPEVCGSNPVIGKIYIEHLFTCFFVDVEGTKEVKRMINLLAIPVNLYHEIDADPSGSGSKTDRVRKQQMLIKYT